MTFPSNKHTVATINGNRVAIQAFDEVGASVMIGKNNNTGQRAAKISFTGRFSHKPTVYVPVEMLSLAAGKDVWMRDIQFRCADETCKQWHPAKDMECELCPACYDKAGEENARLDGGE